MKYQVEAAGSRVRALSRSTLHDVTLTFAGLRGELTIEAGDLRGASARVVVAMANFSTGDKLVDWKVRGELEPARWPEACFVLDAAEGALGGNIIVRGQLDYRGRKVAFAARGDSSVSTGDDAIVVRIGGDLDMRDVGITPPRMLMLKAEPAVRLDIVLALRAD